MTKLQQIKRSNGSVVSSVNFPLEIIEKLGWKKGDELDFEVSVSNSGVNGVFIKKLGGDSHEICIIQEQKQIASSAVVLPHQVKERGNSDAERGLHKKVERDGHDKGDKGRSNKGAVKNGSDRQKKV